MSRCPALVGGARAAGHTELCPLTVFLLPSLTLLSMENKQKAEEAGHTVLPVVEPIHTEYTCEVTEVTSVL